MPTLNRPVIHRRGSDQAESVRADPLPECYGIRKRICLQALLLGNIENLELRTGYIYALEGVQ